MNDQSYMQLAIDEAWRYQLLTYPNPAVGAVVVKDGDVIAVEAHKESGESHAEVNALKTAYLKYFPDSELLNITQSHLIHLYLIEHHNSFFNDCDIYVTLEPCNHIGKTPACANLLQNLKPKRVIIGRLDPNKQASGGLKTLQDASIETKVGVLQKQCDDLLYLFILWQKEKCIFFKMAMRLDGSIDNGIISSQKSLNWVHQIRTKIDLLLIGGNTVRSDRPTLDSRYVNGKAPNIAVYSRSKDTDKTIPLFNVIDRTVTICSDLNILKKKNFVMIEGGYSFLDLMKNQIDILVLVIAANLNEKFNDKKFENDFKLIYQYFNGEDTIVYLITTSRNPIGL